MDIFVRQLSGRLTSGAERGKGTLYHAVPSDSSWDTALCGAKPGRRSGSGFVEPALATQRVTCPRCLASIAVLGKQSESFRRQMETVIDVMFKTLVDGPLHNDQTRQVAISNIAAMVCDIAGRETNIILANEWHGVYQQRRSRYPA